MKQGDEIPEYVKQRLEKLQRELTEAEARLKVVSKHDPLLVDVATALLTAELASDPGRSTPTMDQKVSGSRRPPSPGAHVYKARQAERSLRKNLEDAVRRFDIAAEHNWFPPRAEPEPKKRCINKSCTAYGKRVPKYVGPRGESRIEMVTCQLCQNRLGEA